ncbi:MAG: acyl-CoA thioesterase [Rhodobacteraceae bacterium]|nr:acyl-CoA thioesterase [Paracoccaceae bacterium]
MSTQQPKPFEYPIRVGWADCDPELIAFTGRIPNFALEAIDAWWQSHMGLDWYALNIDRNIGTPFVHLSLDFSSPVTPRHTLICTVELTRLGTKSIQYRVCGYQGGTLCFEGKFVSVFVVAKVLESREPPADLLALLSPLVVEE